MRYRRIEERIATSTETEKSFKEFKNVEGKVIETGDIIYANLNLQNKLDLIIL